MQLFLDTFIKSEDEAIQKTHLDVTDLSNKGKTDTLNDVKILYPGGKFYWHTCRHDEGLGCSSVEA